VTSLSPRKTVVLQEPTTSSGVQARPSPAPAPLGGGRGDSQSSDVSDGECSSSRDVSSEPPKNVPAYANCAAVCRTVTLPQVDLNGGQTAFKTEIDRLKRIYIRRNADATTKHVQCRLSVQSMPLRRM